MQLLFLCFLAIHLSDHTSNNCLPLIQYYNLMIIVIILVQQQPEPEPELPEEEPGLSEEERMQELVDLLSTLAQPTHVKHKTPKAVIIEELDDDEEEE